MKIIDFNDCKLSIKDGAYGGNTGNKDGIIYNGENGRIIILDPQGEYSRLVQELGGITVKVSVGSADHINIMELHRNYGAEAEEDNGIINYDLSDMDLGKMTDLINYLPHTYKDINGNTYKICSDLILNEELNLERIDENKNIQEGKDDDIEL